MSERMTYVNLRIREGEGSDVRNIAPRQTAFTAAGERDGSVNRLFSRRRDARDLCARIAFFCRYDEAFCDSRIRLYYPVITLYCDDRSNDRNIIIRSDIATSI